MKNSRNTERGKIKKMKIDSLTIENFKCFKAEKTFDFGRITILTGANSSGKSSVIYAALGALQSKDFPFNYSLNGKYVQLGDCSDLINEGSSDKYFSVNLLFDSGENIKTKWTPETENNQPNLKRLSFEI